MDQNQATSPSAGPVTQPLLVNLRSPLLVLLVGLAFTAFLTVQLWRQVQAKNRVRFETEVRRATSHIENRLETYMSKLRGGTGLFAANEDSVSINEFRNYVTSLQLPAKYPGIQGIGYARRGTAAERAEFERRAADAGVRGEGGTFRVWPNLRQEEFYSVVFLEPLDRRNLAAIGYDMFSEPVRREAMERARDTGMPAASGKLVLVQEIDPETRQSGFLIYMPFYGLGEIPQSVEARRAAIQGFVYSPFRADDLLYGTVGGSGRAMVDFEVYDGNSTDLQQLLHQSNSDRAGDDEHSLHAIAGISVAGRPWTLRFVPTTSFFAASDYTSVPVTAFVGVIFSLALFGLSGAQVRARRSAEQRRVIALAESRKRREAEEFLLREKNFTDAIADSLPGMFYVVDGEGHYLRWNATLERVTGYTAEQIASMRPRDYFRPRHHALLDQATAEVFHKGFSRMEAPLLTADGREIPYLFTGVKTVFDGRECVVGLAIDITEQHRSREALARSNQRLEMAQRAGKIGSFEWNLRTHHITWSDMEEQLYGLPAGRFGGSFEQWLQLVHPEDRELARTAITDAIAHCSDLLLEFRIVRPDGSVRWLLAQGTVICDSHGAQRMVGVNVDITDRKRAELEAARHRDHLEDLVAERTAQLERTHQRLRLSERMAALGTLSAGLGHDMGNLLLPIRLRLDAMEVRGISSEASDDVQAIRKCAEYLQRLVNGLRLFALDPADAHASSQRTNMYEWWDDVKPFLHNTLPQHVSLEREFAPNLPPLQIPRHMLTQVMFNLVQNAGDAMRGCEMGAVRVWAESAPERGFVRLGVSDNGAGMSAETLRRCMEPFFTTKTRGLSTGLGLSLVHGIIHNLGGQVQVQSSPGSGTAFTLLIPIAPPAPPVQKFVRPRALVSLHDQRLQAYVTSVLQTMSFDVSSAAHPDSRNAWLWVTEARDDVADELKRFLSHNPRRRALVFGKPPGELDTSTRSIVTVEPSPKPAIIRQALQRIANDVQEQARRGHRVEAIQSRQ